jgi:hypothetical protein
MSGTNGSRECAPDDKLRDTHQLVPTLRAIAPYSLNSILREFMPAGATPFAIAPYALLQGFGGSLGANAA